MPKIPRVGLAPFSMTDEEIEEAMKMPLGKAERLELKLLPDSDERPNYLWRILATGFYVWRSRGDRPLSRLAQHLLYLYFTGQLRVASSEETVSRVAHYDDEPDFFEGDGTDFNDDFGFVER